MLRHTTIAVAVMLVEAVSAAPPAQRAPASATTSTAEKATTAAKPSIKLPSIKLATIKEIRRIALADGARITVELDGEVPFHDERIADPSRVFVDMSGTRATPDLADRTLRFDEDAQVVHQVRVGRHPNNTTRIVLDAIGVTSYSVYPLYNPYRLVIDCIGVNVVSSGDAPLSAPHPPPPAPALASHWSTTAWIRHAPNVSPRKSAELADARADGSRAVSEGSGPPASERPSEKATEKLLAKAEGNASQAGVGTVGSVAPVTPVTPVASGGSAAGFSMARQLGLGVSRIVIDPGHGGHDSGAQGKGVTEAELVLDVALRLEKLLQKSSAIEVVLTRRTDEFIPLQERTAIANREGADLFLSIHANASPSPQARGVETYFLNFANNLSAAAVAARENAASGQAMGALPDFVKAIALNNKLDESRNFANEVQHAMLERLRTSNKMVKSLGVKQAPFVVLIGAAMPSVLAEISFVTNLQEARLLKSSVYRQHIAEALFGAIRKYQSSLAHVTSARAGRETPLPRAEPEHDAGESHSQRNRERE